MNEYDTEPPAHEHAEWFMQLPVSTRHWLENLRKEDIAEIKDAIKMKRRVEAGVWGIKWLAATVVIFFVGAASLGESLQKLWALLFHAVKP